MKKLLKLYNVHIRIIAIYVLMVVVGCLIFYPLMPLILNYPEGTVGTLFQKELEGTTYFTQFIGIIFAAVAVYSITVFLSLRFLKTFYLYKDHPNSSKQSEDSLHKVRDKLFTVPYHIYFIQITCTSILIAFLHIFTTNIIGITTLKILIFFFSFITIVASFCLIYTRQLFTALLVEITPNIDRTFKKTSLRAKIYYQIIPIFIVAVLFSALLGYTYIIKEKANIQLNMYKEKISNYINNYNANHVNDLLLLLNDVQPYNENDIFFVKTPTGDIFTKNNIPFTPSKFFLKYMDEFSNHNNGRLYDYYGVDVQGYKVDITIDNQLYIFGVQYSLSSYDILFYYLISFIALFILSIIILRYFSKLMTNDINLVSKRLTHISETSNIVNETNLSLTSNDEIGELILAFNNIQDLTKENIKQIHDSQETIMEKDRLASLRPINRWYCT